ncbi:MAG TPA: redoxin domain-containing protein, partial [Segetibacter sp.]
FAQRPAVTVPDFDFYRLDDQPFTKKDLAASKMLLFIFFDVTCDHCHRAIQQFNNRHTELKNTAVYLISLDTKSAITNFLNTNAKNLTTRKNVIILQDLKNEFITRFQPRKYPSVFLYSAQKKLIMYDDEEKNVPKFLQEINSIARK